jgi:hypothetical protein
MHWFAIAEVRGLQRVGLPLCNPDGVVGGRLKLNIVTRETHSGARHEEMRVDGRKNGGH